MRRLPLILLFLAGTTPLSPVHAEIVRGPRAYDYFPAKVKGEAAASYRIGSLDTIAIAVFQEPDLTAKDLQVDAAGKVVLPLIGSIQAAGLTATELGAEIGRQLSKSWLVNPQVSVVVQNSVSQKVTVQGAVTEPGVYQLSGPTTLLDALAMAKGPSRVASLGNVAVLREVDGKRVGAVFDIKRISSGDLADPVIRGNDTIIVGSSGLKAAWRDVLSAAPLASIFRPF